MSSQEQGRISAQLVVKILTKRFNDLPLITIPKTIPMFNYKMLEKHNVSMSMLPKNSKILNKPKTFIENNQNSISVILVVFPIVILFLLIIIYNIIVNRRIEKKLTIQSTFDEVLLKNVNSIVFWCNCEEEVIKYNDAFSNMIGKSTKDIIGVKIEELIPTLYKKIKNDGHSTNKIEFSHKINKKMHWFLLGKYNIKISDNNLGFIVVMQDVTKEKKKCPRETSF